MSDGLRDALGTAGFALAHGIGSIRFGGTLCTLAWVVEPGRRTLVRYEAPSIPDSLVGAREHLAQAISEDGNAALVYDGFVTTAELGRIEPLLVDVLGPSAVRLGWFAQPYRPARRLGLPIIGSRLAVVGLPLLDESIEIEDAQEVIRGGILEHPSGTSILRLTEP